MKFEELKGVRTPFFLAVLNSVVMEWAAFKDRPLSIGRFEVTQAV